MLTRVHYPSHIKNEGLLPLDAGTITATPGDGTVAIAQGTAPSGGTESYTRDLYRSTSSGSKGSLLASDVTLPYDDDTAVNDTTYYYTLEVDDGSTTEDTAQVSATPTSSGFATPDVIDNLFDDGVSGDWDGVNGSGQISLISDPTGSFGGRQVAEHAFYINSASHVDDPVYRYKQDINERGVYTAIDFELTNAVRDGDSPQRKLIYYKGDKNYGSISTWTLIVTEWGSVDGLYVNGDDGTGFISPIQIGTTIDLDVPYRIELYVYVNDEGSSNGIVRVWLTNLDTGPGDRTLIYENTSFQIDALTGSSYRGTVDRIEVGHQLDNGGDPTEIYDDRIFDRMMISTQPIGTYGLS